MEYEDINVKAKHYPCGDVDVIEIRGELTQDAKGAFFDVLNPLFVEERRKIVLDLSSITYVNSTGIGLLGTLLIRFNRERARLALVVVSPLYRSIFQVHRNDDAAPIFPTASEAVAWLRDLPLPPPPLRQ